jgi:hypothetical protein
VFKNETHFNGKKIIFNHLKKRESKKEILQIKKIKITYFELLFGISSVSI